MSGIRSVQVRRARMPRVDPEWRTASYAASVLEGFALTIEADGLTGIGGTSAHPTGIPADELDAQLNGLVRDKLLGADPFARTRIIADLRAAGAHRSAVTAVDFALHDLLGKAAELPCYALWGGAAVPSLGVVRMVGIKAPAALVTAVGTMVGQGFSHFKVKLGTGIAEDVDRIRALRDNFGGSIWIGIDGNGSYAVDDAIELSRALEPYDVKLIEQPINYRDLEGLIRLTGASPVPIMADQYVNSPAAALEVCQRHAADVISLKIGQLGSLDECRSAAAMCLNFGIGVHIGGSAHPAVVDAAHAHLAVSVPGISAECEIGESLAVEGDPTTGLGIRDGRWEPSTSPGLGISLAA